MLDFTGQVVVVTGAGGNLGSAIAQTLARQGAMLALADMRQPMLERTLAAVEGHVHVTIAGASVYAASKAAVLRITEAVAEENKAQGITANCVRPGTIDTPQNRADMPTADHTLWVSPANIAAVVAFLVSREAGAVTGAAVPITGRQ